MKRVLQAKSYRSPSRRGDCFRAGVASLLELPLDDVPHFMQDQVSHPLDPEWNAWARVNVWLGRRGLELCSCDPEPDEFVLAFGPPVYHPNLKHCVVQRNGRTVHDPDPRGVGLARTEWVMCIRPLERKEPPNP